MPTTTIRGVALDHDDLPDRHPSGPRSARTLIWGHGLTSSRADELVPPVLIHWDRITPLVDVVRYDARGHGRSATTAEPSDYGWDALALDQLALADHLGVDRYVAGGASMGCGTALHVAVTAPHRVDALVLVIPPTAWASRAAQVGNYRVAVEVLGERGVEPLIAAGRLVPPPDPFADDPAWRDRSAARLRAADPARLAIQYGGAATADFPPPDRLAAIVVPTLILAWTGDPAHPAATAHELGDLWPHAEVHVASSPEQFATWTDRIAEFLDR